MNNILLCGVGGQGTVLASKLIAFAAMEKGLQVRTAETIGMAQRGGSVVSHVRIGEEIHSPLLPKGSADVIIAFEPAEAVRCISYLKKGGTVIVNKKAVRPVTASLQGTYLDGEDMLRYLQSQAGHVDVMDGEAICEACGSSKILNIVLLAAAAKSGALGITPEELDSAIDKRISEKFRALNKKAIAMVMNQ
ncbi:MAG: indolepyruvate oxidoreductase subunit beta [Lachnospiraceae bacterium]|nr:indolepyruvate oxidoreductase subunit beta [Lachnospiraceae bacterium]MBP3505023.1 indolepyruvate oxidoreductase subunit beta [Lachnospiraceae bacterium]